MSSLAKVFDVLNEMKQVGVVTDYALAGAMALVFWTEPIPTYDVDVLVWLPTTEARITTLAPLYDWARARGHPAEAEHVIIETVPVQFLPAHNALTDEAIESAATLDYSGVSVRVVRPEYLIALYLEPSSRTAKRRERAAALAESAAVDQARLAALLVRYNLEW